MSDEVSALFSVSISVNRCLDCCCFSWGAELRNPRGGLVGKRASAPCRVDLAVRPVWTGGRFDHHRFRECRPVDLLRCDLDRHGYLRRKKVRAAAVVRRRHHLVARKPNPGLPRVDPAAIPAERLHHRRLHVGRRGGTLALLQLQVGLASAGDLFAVRPWRAVPASHPPHPAAAAPCGDRTGVRQHLVHGIEFGGAALHHLHRLHPDGDGQGACRLRPQSRGPARPADRRLESAWPPGRERTVVSTASEAGTGSRRAPGRSRQFQIDQ